MVRSTAPFALVLTSALIAAAAPAWSRADDSPAPPKPAEASAPDADGTSLYTIPGQDPPQRFVPLHPRTVEDRRRIEALRDYSTARALEDRREWSQAIALHEQALKIEPDSIAILRRLSRLCFALGRTEAAVSYSRRVLTADPGNSEMISRLVAHYLKKKDPAGAQAMLKEILENPALGKDEAGRLLAEFELGKLYAGRLQEIDKAADAFAHVVDALDNKAANRLSPADQRRILGTDEAGAYLDFGLIFLQAKRYDQAVKAFERGLVYDPDHSQLSLQLAETLEKAGKGHEALAVVERYLKRQPQGVEGYELLAKVLTALKREAEITPRLEQAAKVDSKNVTLQYALADRYRETGQPDKADALYKALLTSQPTSQGYGALSASLLKRKKTEELLKVVTEALTKPENREAVLPQLNAIGADPAYAEQVLEVGYRMLSADPPTLDKSGIDVLAYIATRSNKLEKLIPIQRLALTQNPSPRAYLELIQALLGAGKFAEGAAAIEELMGKFPDEKNARQYVFLGKVRRAAQQNDAALDAIRQAIKLDPNDAEAQVTLCQLLAQSGKIGEAIEIAKSALTNDPANPDFNRMLGILLIQGGKEGEALALYKSLLEKYPNNEGVVHLARSGLSVIYVNQGDFAKGEAELEALLEREPEDAGVNNDLGYLYADQGKNLEKAEAMIRKAIQEEPENPAYLDRLGWVLFKRGKAKEAVGHLEKAVSLPSGTDATIQEHLGDVYFQLQQPAKAKAAWKAAEAAGAKATPSEKRLPEIRKKLESLEKLGQAPRPSTGESP